MVAFINSTAAGDAHDDTFNLKKGGPIAQAYRRCLAGLGYGFDLTAVEYNTCSKLMKASALEKTKREKAEEDGRVLKELSEMVAEQTGFAEGTEEHTAALAAEKVKVANGEDASALALVMHEQGEQTFAQTQGAAIAVALQELLDAGMQENDVLAKANKITKELRRSVAQVANSLRKQVG